MKVGERPAHAAGRWPANICHDGSDEVVAAFPESRIAWWGNKLYRLLAV
jgi:hypothetical protein